MRKIFLKHLLMIASAAFFAGVATSQDAEQKFVLLPITSQKIALRVLVVNNERLPELDIHKARKILNYTQLLAKNELGLDIAFEEPRLTNFKTIKSLIKSEDVEWIKRQSLNLSRTEDVNILKKAMRRDLKLGGEVASDIQNYANPLLVTQPVDKSEIAFADALVNTQVALKNQWDSQKLKDGQPLLGDDLFNEYSFWQILGHRRLPFEVVLTNQIIVSAEKYGNSVHSALRGGVSNGITGSSYLSNNGTFSVISSYPFYSQDTTTTSLRAGKRYSEDEAALYAAALLTHELGHQLLHLGHPFNNPACIMRPPQRLEFDTWYKNLNAEKCKLNSNDAMTPGKTVKHSDIRAK